MKIISILLAVVLFAGCAETSSVMSIDDTKPQQTGYSYGEITAYQPISPIESPWWIVRARKENKWGYVDSPSGTIVIPFVYDFTDDFVHVYYRNSNFIARVRQDGKWGFINERGEVMIPLVYDQADQFMHNMGDFLAKVSLGGRSFMINTSGIETKRLQWCEVISDTEVWVENGVETLLRVNCDRKFGFAVEKAWADQPEKQPKRSPLSSRYYTREMLKIVIPTIYDDADNFRTLMVNGKRINLARVGLHGYGFINEKGEAVIPTIYDSIDLLRAMGPPGSEKYIAKAEVKKKFGYINERGETIIPFLYESAGSFYNEKDIVVKDSVAVKRESKWGLIDYTGRITIPIMYDRIDPFQRFKIVGEEMLVAMVQRGGKWGLVDHTGKVTIPIMYDRIDSLQQIEIEGRETLVAMVTRNEKSGFIETTGEIIIPLDYEIVFPFKMFMISERKVAISRVKRDNKWGFIDATRKIIIPFKYEDADDFHRRGKYNVARVKSNGKWIYIDDSDNQIDHTADFRSDPAVIQQEK